MAGWPGKAPLPPLNGVLIVIRSRPLLKSAYSLSVLTLMCAHKAAIITSISVAISIDPLAAIAVLAPSNTHTGDSIKKEGLVV
jgi:hypothetical protein